MNLKINELGMQTPKVDELAYGRRQTIGSQKQGMRAGFLGHRQA